MAYNQDTPDALTETFSVSQPKIKENFTQIKTLVDQDHETFDAANGAGKHKQLTFPAQTAHSTTSVSERAIYCKNNAAGDPALWIQAAGVLVAAAGTDFTSYTNVANQGHMLLPSGLLVCWGNKSLGVGTLTDNIGFSTNFAASSPFQVITSVSGVGGGKTDAQNVAIATTYTVSTVTFTRSRSENEMNCRYIAIGLPA